MYYKRLLIHIEKGIGKGKLIYVSTYCLKTVNVSVKFCKMIVTIIQILQQYFSLVDGLGHIMVGMD